MRSCVTLVVAIVASWPVATAAAQVTFDEALALGARSPEAVGPRRALSARRAGDDDIGGTAQQTQVTVMPGALIAPDQEQGFELQINATQGWNLADLGGARRHAAAIEREALAARARVAALRARLDAARWWIDLRTLESLDALFEEQARLAQQLVETTERAAEGGVATASDVADARAVLAEVRQRRLALEGERFEAATELAVAMGRGAGPPIRTAGPAPNPRLPDAAVLRARFASLDALPTVAAARLAAAAARAREVEAAAAYAPVLQVGSQLERTAAGGWILFGVAGLSFNAFGQENRATSLARAEAAQAETEAETARLRAGADLVAALHEVEHARHVVAGLERELLPALQAMRARHERALELGEGTVFEAMEARRRLLAARAELARAQGVRWWAELRMWLLLSQLAAGAEEET